MYHPIMHTWHNKKKSTKVIWQYHSFVQQTFTECLLCQQTLSYTGKLNMNENYQLVMLAHKNSSIYLHVKLYYIWLKYIKKYTLKIFYLLLRAMQIVCFSQAPASLK